MTVTREQLNEFYKRLDDKRRELSKPYTERTVGWFNGHYRMSSSGEYKMDYYPIPEITIPGLCDIEINPDDITISTKLTREAAISYDYKRLSGYSFEAFGVEDYLNDFYCAGKTIDELISSVQKSSEKEIGFAFCFTHELDGDALFRFVQFIRDEGFFY